MAGVTRPPCTSALEPIDAILELYRIHGSRAYLGEPVSIVEHVLQAAEIAERASASSALVSAALLHDVGHLLHDQAEDCAESGIDSRHEEVGAAFLRGVFPAAVV